MKKISVVIPVYNRKINMRLVNIFYKFKKYLNVIIVEDGSRKEIILYNKKLLKKYSNVKYFSYKKNKGQSFACNFGIRKTKTKYIWFFDDDDFLSNRTIKEVLKSLKLNREGYLMPMKQIYNGVVIKFSNPSKRPHDFNDLRNNGQLVSTSCSIFKTKLIRKIKGWDNYLYGGTDTDLFLRFSKIGQFKFIDCNPIIINISQPGRLTNKVFRQQLAKLRFLIKHWKILTIKRKLYYILTALTFYPLFYRLKNKIIYLKQK